MWVYTRFRKTGMIECILIKGANMTGYPTKGRWVLLKLFLSRRVIFIKAVSCRVNLRCLPKHGGDGSFYGGPVAEEPAPLCKEVLLPALPLVHSELLPSRQRVLHLRAQEARCLRDIVLLLDPPIDRAIRKGDGFGDFHPRALHLAMVDSLRILSQGGEGIERIATTTVPKGEALCLGERPDFHARSQGLVFCSRKKCGIILEGRR